LTNVFRVVSAEFLLVYGEYLRRKVVLITMAIWPYVMTLFILLIGTSYGSRTDFIERLGVAPEIYMLTANFLLMSFLSTSDDILWRPLADEWQGTLPYIIASPTHRLVLYMAIPIPRLLLILFLGFASILPAYIYLVGVSDGLRLFTTASVVGLSGAILMVPLSMIIAGIVGVVGESWRILGIVRPILMILLGALYPRTLMPLLLQVASMAIPPSHLVEALIKSLTESLSSVEALMYIGIATALFIIYTPLGVRSIAVWERRKVSEGVKVG